MKLEQVVKVRYTIIGFKNSHRTFHSFLYHIIGLYIVKIFIYSKLLNRIKAISNNVT